MVSDLFIILGMVMMMWLCDVIVWCDAVYSVMFYVQPKTDCGGAGDNYKKYSRHQTNLHRALQPTMLLYKDCRLHNHLCKLGLVPWAMSVWQKRAGVCNIWVSDLIPHHRPQSERLLTCLQTAELDDLQFANIQTSCKLVIGPPLSSLGKTLAIHLFVVFYIKARKTY